MIPVKISEIVDALEMQFDELKSYLDTETGQVETISREMLLLAGHSRMAATRV